MKRVFYIIFGVTAITGILSLIGLRAVQKEIVTPVNSPSPTSIEQPQSPMLTVDDNGHTIAYVIQLSPPKNVSLYSNLDTATASSLAREKHSCRSLVNAGFYTKEMTHLGRFSGTDGEYSGAIESTLLDGFLSIDSTYRARIGFDEPNAGNQIVLQSGPIIRQNGSIRPLRLIEDKFARRIIAGVTNSGELLFMALYFPDQEYSGPLLARVPSILEKIAQKERLEIIDAINLDGGSASAFIQDTVALTELNPVGGFFCIRQ